MSLRLGDRVRARLLDTGGHHRLPRYVQGRVGTVVAYRGEFPLPDAVVHGGALVQRGLYCVRFAASELWPGDSAASSGRGAAADREPADHGVADQGAEDHGVEDHGVEDHAVHLDLFERYLRYEGLRFDEGEEASS